MCFELGFNAVSWMSDGIKGFLDHPVNSMNKVAIVSGTMAIISYIAARVFAGGLGLNMWTGVALTSGTVAAGSIMTLIIAGLFVGTVAKVLP